MRFLSFFRRWVWGALKRSVGLGDFIASILGSSLTVFLHFYPAYEPAMTDLLWQIPLYGLAAAMAWRLLVVPYELWLDAETRAGEAVSNEDAVRQAVAIEEARQKVIDNAERKREFHRNVGRKSRRFGNAFSSFERDALAQADAQREIDKQKAIREAMAEPKQSKPDMPIREVIKYLAFESQWAEDYDASQALEAYRPQSTTEYKWTHDLNSEFLRAAPEIKSRGIHQKFEQRPDNGRSDIPDSFWQRADMDVIDMLCTDFASIAYIGGEQVYRDIVFDKQEIEARWPPRPRSRKWTAFRKLARPWKENADNRAAFSEGAWGNIA